MTNLIIEKIVLGGMGLAHLADGMVVLIANVLPGEEVTANISRRHKGYAEAKLLEVVKSSPHRVQPPCPDFAQCGGCKLMYADYAFQCRIKEDCLRDVLDRGLRREDQQGFSFERLVPSANPLNYRQRIRLQADERGRLGYFQAQTHQQVDISACLLAAPALNEVLLLLAEAPEMMKWGGVLVAVELLFSPLDAQVVVIVHLKRRARPADRKAAENIAKRFGQVKAIWLAAAGASQEGPYTGTKDFNKDDVAIRFEQHSAKDQALGMGCEAGGFCQVNLSLNDELVKLMLDWAGVRADERVLDLYCGLGNLSLPVARHAAEVVGIDVQRATIRSANKNALHNQIKNCRFIQADVGAAVSKLLGDDEIFDLIIIDPPRQGCKEVVNSLAGLDAKRIIYVSCDPATLVRDLNSLATYGYVLQKVCGLDMFPQTSHMETIALLDKK
jgi:23S rRNA (uracil1939-C5)-methyltransferase